MDSNIYKEEEVTKEILLKEYETMKEKHINKGWYYDECSYCKQPKQVMLNIDNGRYIDEKLFMIDKEKHDICNKIAKYESLSIFDKYHKENTFDKAKIVNDKEISYLESFKKYCDNFEKAKENGIGLLLTGLAGTGKTFYSKISLC